MVKSMKVANAQLAKPNPAEAARALVHKEPKLAVQMGNGDHA